MNTNFENRIKTILCGRKIHTWGNKIGLSRGVISGISKGKLPNADKFGPIIRTENASLTWLIEGKGEKFLVNHCYSDTNFCEQLTAYYDEQWKTHLLVDGFNMAVVLTQPGSYKIDNVDYLYTIVEVFVGPAGDKLLLLLAQQNNDSNTFFVETGIAYMQDLYKGNIGTYGLLHTADALLNKARRLPVKEAQRFAIGNQVAEQQTHYESAKVSADEMALVEDLRQLNSTNFLHMKAVIHSLAGKAGSGEKK